MENTTLHIKTKQTQTPVLCIPTRITKQEPIFFIDFLLENNSKIQIRLNELMQITDNRSNYIVNFDNNGCCTINHKITDYYIRGEIKLLNYTQDMLINQQTKCRLSLNYGKENKDIYYLKGCFKLADFTND